VVDQGSKTPQAETSGDQPASRPKGLLVAAAALAPFVAVIAVYLPDLGQGFVRDDFAWLRHAQAVSVHGLPQFFKEHTGFYRPLVGLSFAFDLAVHGLRPQGYALTNALLVLATMAAVFALARALGLAWGAGVVACGVWALNPHGISGLMLWISGRTAGLLTLCASLAALAFVKGHTRSAVVFVLLSLLAKEEALLLPAILTAWGGWLGRPVSGRRVVPETAGRWNGRAAFRRAWPLWLPLLVYLPMRFATSAYYYCVIK
jgi:hypothetical protein